MDTLVFPHYGFFDFLIHTTSYTASVGFMLQSAEINSSYICCLVLMRTSIQTYRNCLVPHT